MSIVVATKPFCPRITRSKISKLTRDLQNAMKLVRASTERRKSWRKLENRPSWMKIVKKLGKKWDFQIKEADGLSGYIAVSHTHGLVIKCPYGASPSGMPTHAIFTRIVKFWTNDRDDNSHMFIQPLADVSTESCERAHAAIGDAVYQGIITKPAADDHDGNVALFMGKAVAIDW